MILSVNVLTVRLVFFNRKAPQGAFLLVDIEGGMYSR